MRKSVGAIAIIRKLRGDHKLYLMQWNSAWKAYHFIGGHKQPTESFRECAIREVTEELALSYPPEFSVSPEPLSHLEYTALSERAKIETFYVLELFEVALTDETIHQKVTAHPQNRWVTQGEILAQNCADGRPVSPSAFRQLSESKLL